MSTFASILRSAFAAAMSAEAATAAAEDRLERRRNYIMATVGICLALRAMDEEHGGKNFARLGESPPALLTAAIIGALDDGKSLDEATAAVIAAMEGD